MKKEIKKTVTKQKAKQAVVNVAPKVKEVKAKRKAPDKFNAQKFERARRKVFSLPGKEY